MPIEFTLLGQSDIDDIFSYTLIEWGQTQHSRYQAVLDKAFTLIAENPRIGRLVCEDGSRVCTAGKHRIYYRMESDRILILRILHERMDSRQWIGEN